MERKMSFGLVLAVMIGFSCSSEAYVFVVGGRDGWDRHLSEGYDHWSSRNRFQVNDSLLFLYRRGADSVLAVTRDDYTSCNTKSPLISFTDGNSLFILIRSGPFFFISGNPGSCNGGQKLTVTVLAQRKKPPSPPSSSWVPHPSGVALPAASSSPAILPVPGASGQSGTRPNPQVPAPSPSFAPAGCSCSGAVVLGLSGIVSYLMSGKVLFD